jgi:hypothetical protein
VRTGPDGSDPAAPRPGASLAPEHHWPAALGVLHPVLRPVGTAGVDGSDLSVSPGRALPAKPLVAEGPAGLVVAYVIPGQGFGVFAGIEHLLAWNVGPRDAHAAAMSNLAAWSAAAPWIAEGSGARRILCSAAGGGMDAARVLLPEVRDRLAAELGRDDARVLIGLPERDLLIAASLSDGDGDFAGLLAAYVAERWEEAEDPISDQLFELADGSLTIFEAAAG